MKVLLYEQWYGGHHDNYLRVLAPAIASLGVDLVVAGTAKTYASNTSALESLAKVVLAEPLPEVHPELAFADRRAATRNLLRCIDDVKPDWTIVSSADAQAQGLAWTAAVRPERIRRLGPIETTLHYGYGWAARSTKQRLKELLYSTTYRGLRSTSVNFVNFAYHEYAVARGLQPPGRTRLVGDPVPEPAAESRREAKVALGLDPDSRYVGLVGSLDGRKAIPALLAAFARADLAANDRLLLAGRLDPAHRQELERHHGPLLRSGRIVVMDRFLSDREIQLGYRALDVATPVYRAFPGLASLALKAVACGTPIVVHDFGWMGALVRRFGVGEAVDALDIDALAAALARVLASPEAYPLEPEAVRRLLAFHGESAFAAHMTESLRAAHGVHSPDVARWEQVMEALPPGKRTVV